MHFHLGEVDGDVVIPVVKILNRSQDGDGDQDPRRDGIEVQAGFMIHEFHFFSFRWLVLEIEIQGDIAVVVINVNFALLGRILPIPVVVLVIAPPVIIGVIPPPTAVVIAGPKILVSAEPAVPVISPIVDIVVVVETVVTVPIIAVPLVFAAPFLVEPHAEGGLDDDRHLVAHGSVVEFPGGNQRSLEALALGPGLGEADDRMGAVRLEDLGMGRNWFGDGPHAEVGKPLAVIGTGVGRGFSNRGLL